MRFVLLCCLVAYLPAFAADADTHAALSAKQVKHSHPSARTKPAAVSKPVRFASPEDYDFDHLLRCAVGCWG